MRSSPFHPDQLEPGGEVGPWRVVASLGAGGFGRVFKVERGGRFFTMKMALRPAGPQASEEEDINGRLSHEVATLLACAPHPNLPRVHTVDRWPEPPDGYLYFVTDFIDGETFHEWRWRVKPSAAHLLTVFTEVVRAVADLHRRGLHHRDVKGDNLLIRREDERPFLIDLGTVRLPGATTLTVGVAPASPHLLPPECVAFLREGSWAQGARFDAGVPGDLYALGALLYEALTDGYAFDPRLPYDRLLPAIETVTPRAPHLINPKVPPALGDVAMRLLAKRPEDRYAGTEALLQALWEVAKEKRQPAWKVSLDRPPEAPGAPEGAEQEALPRVRVVPELDHAPSEEPEVAPAPTLAPVEPRAPERDADVPGERLEGAAPVLPSRGEGAPLPARRRGAVALGLGAMLLLALGVFAQGLVSHERPASPEQAAIPPPPPAEKGSPVVTSRSPSTPETTPSPSPIHPREVGDLPEVVARTATVDGEDKASEDKTLETEAAQVPSVARKRSSARSAVAKTAVAACLAGACAGGPAPLRDEPPVQDCPAATLAVMNEVGFTPPKLIGSEFQIGMLHRLEIDPQPAPPDGGTLTLNTFGERPYIDGYMGPGVPVGSKFRGKVFWGKDRLFGWITEIILPDGRRLPLCANITDPNRTELGMPYEPGSTPERPLISPQVFFAATKRLGRL
ncbi:protein kinase [Myxococcus sp. K15C18031901]|uniref:serine/threonine protein kinase n=1 Tax=Myxococcus dinghuensis TaxID=2906761 RepID=UPI0020A7D16E|nr:protein kinase [Myxococcus dinghuensis]MCP3097572.1 protein kinase [Myxococcus dinghuensis]